MSDQTTPTRYIKNCESFRINFNTGNSLEGTLKREKCSNNNILNQNGTKCLNNVLNCKLASSTNDE